MAPKRKSSKTTEDLKDKDIARFLTRGHSVREIANSLHQSQAEIKRRLEKGLEGYELYKGPKNIQKEQTFVAVPSVGTTEVPPRAWGWIQDRRDNHPYGAVLFPEDFNFSKIRIVPLDSIYFGDESHDAERFEHTLRVIAKTPNTFCFLNGDILGLIKGGRRDIREQMLLDRLQAFTALMRPVMHKILWAQRGCLERKIYASQGFDPLEFFCAKFGIPYFTQPVFIDLFWGNRLFTLWTMHGRSAARLKGSRINALRHPSLMLEYTNFVIQGHIGDALINSQPRVIRRVGTGRLLVKNEYHLTLGSFRRYFGTEAAIKADMPPVQDTIILYIYADGTYRAKTTRRISGDES